MAQSAEYYDIVVISDHLDKFIPRVSDILNLNQKSIKKKSNK